MQYAWITDPHFDLISLIELVRFGEKLNNFDGILISGDISDAGHVTEHLTFLSKFCAKPIYFTLGNHDFYNSDFLTVKKNIDNLVSDRPNLNYLSHSDIIEISPGTALIGHDGWYGADWVEPLTSLVFSWDWFFIHDFKKLLDNEQRLQKVKDLTVQAAEIIEARLKKAIEKYSTVFLLTHIPPWPDLTSGWKLLDRFWTPYNSSKCISDKIKNVMDQNPNKQLIILSGHTHIERKVKISPNIELRVGGVQTGKTQIQEVFTIL